MSSPKIADISPSAIAGRRIRTLRKMMGLSQSHLADKLDVSYQQIQKYESGATNISLNTLFKISEVLDEAPTSFLELTPHDRVANDQESSTCSHAVEAINIKIANVLSELNDKEISASILKLLNSFIDPVATNKQS